MILSAVIEEVIFSEADEGDILSMKRTGFSIFLALSLGSAAMAGDMVYTPVNPSFGGNPLNSSHLTGC